MSPSRPAPFVIVSTNLGTMIVNRNDHCDNLFGVGHALLSTSNFEPEEIGFSLELLNRRRTHSGDGLVVLDCGANIGTHSVEWGRHMYGWGRVIAFEPQETVYYALAGNIVINNCLNVRAMNCAVGSSVGTIKVPRPDYLVPSSYGSLELRRGPNTEFIGQAIDYDRPEASVPVVTIDSLELDRLDFVKLDVEGMEVEALEGARRTLEMYRPILMVEMIKSDAGAIFSFLEGLGYVFFRFGINIFAVHGDDPVKGHDAKCDRSEKIR